jgi:hypothetical protein
MTSIAIVGEAWGEIELTLGMKALVDLEDFERVNKLTWCAIRRPSGVYHAMRKDACGQTEFMHHYILRVIPSVKTPVDHDNGNGLDNRKFNIKVVTPRINALNTARSRKAKIIEPHGNRFRVRPFINGKRVNLGSFATEAEAMGVLQEYRQCKTQ